MATDAQNVVTWFDAVLKQISAESFFHDIDLSDPAQVSDRLAAGNTPPNSSPQQYIKMTPTQASGFLDRYQIVDQVLPIGARETT